MDGVWHVKDTVLAVPKYFPRETFVDILGSSALLALHLWPTGVLSYCHSHLEFTARWSAGSGTEFRLFQAIAEDSTYQCIQHI